MIVNGKDIAEEIFREIKNEVSHLSHAPHLTVFTCAPNFETQKYLGIKTRKAKEVGIGINVIEFGEDITTQDFVISVQNACMQTDGVVVQLPLPAHLDLEQIIAAIPAKMDVDGMHYDGTANYPIHPVAGAVAYIAHRYDVLMASQNVVVVGEGRLVGRPVAEWARMQGGKVTVLNEASENKAEAIKNADILILGAGSPALIKPEIIKDGVVIFDAGTSELGGKLAGDADPACAEKASLFTPVPKGIGPITVAILLRNVMEVVRDSH